MIVVVEPGYSLQSSIRANSEEIALIWDVNQRSSLLHKKAKNFSYKEYQVIKRGERALEELLKLHQRLIQGLVTAYHTKIYNFKNIDLEQEATLAFFDAIATFDIERGTKLSSWAYIQIRARLQTLARRIINHTIASARTVRTEISLTEIEPLPEQGFFEQIDSMLKHLTQKQRQVISLQLQGLSWSDIALKLDITANAVRMRWNRAVQQLRLLLGEKEGEQRQKPINLQFTQESNNFTKLLPSRPSSKIQPSKSAIWKASHSRPSMVRLVTLRSRKILHCQLSKDWSEPSEKFFNLKNSFLQQILTTKFDIRSFGKRFLYLGMNLARQKSDRLMFMVLKQQQLRQRSHTSMFYRVQQYTRSRDARLNYHEQKTWLFNYQLPVKVPWFNAMWI